ncbi:COP9 signalosome complex subunit 2 [Gaertneriomyces sp. JEL0708]|nr:COP9 signalosome complex subunit 2 [Gaertneriomyces sp. JEL0708]
MSDDDDFMHDDDDDDEEYDFDYEDDDDEEPDVGLENRYYNAKGHNDDDPDTAIAEFQSVVESEEPKGEWGFKALKQIVKLSFKLANHPLTLSSYEQLLTYVRTSVTRNYSEKSINNILDYVSTSSDMEFLEEFYSLTLKALEEARNERLWTKTNLKLARVWLDRREFARFKKILRALHASLPASSDEKKGTLLLDILALEIQMHTLTSSTKKLQSLYHQSLTIKSAIPHPRTMGIIRECGGKMHMQAQDWSAAQLDFFEAFKNYDEAGDPQRLQCLKYLVLANMLSESTINPFDSQETKPYKSDPQIEAIMNMVMAYQRRELHEVERILRVHKDAILGDEFIRGYMDDVLRNIRTQVLMDLIRPYTRIELSFVAKQLNISPSQVESLLISLILDKKIDGRIDQVNGRLELDKTKTKHASDVNASDNAVNFDEALEKWSENLQGLLGAVVSKVAA